jgi:hypothetical protein
MALQLPAPMVVFFCAQAMLSFAEVAVGAEALATGRAVDGTGQGVAGVEVHLVNKDITATTGADGRFELFEDVTAHEQTIRSATGTQISGLLDLEDIGSTRGASACAARVALSRASVERPDSTSPAARACAPASARRAHGRLPAATGACTAGEFFDKTCL